MPGLREGGIRRKLVAIMVSEHVMTLRSLMNILFSSIRIFQYSVEA
jgi:hypothetical protein